jgi:spore coat polysaccharide biosynthesis protein SpsF
MKNSVVNIVGVLEAQMNPQKLPHKAILSLAGKPLLLTVIERIKSCKLIETLVVSTSTEEIDSPVYQLCKKERIAAFRGEKKKQLDIDYKIALKYDADVLLKVSMNEPLIDPSVITKVLKYFIENQEKYDYVSNLNPATYPKGNEVEVVSFEGLRNSWKLADNPCERENSTFYIRNNPQKFSIGNVICEGGYDYSKTFRWLLDYEEDYIFVKKIFDELYFKNPVFNLHDILLLLDEYPALKYINSKYLGVNLYNNMNSYNTLIR